MGTSASLRRRMGAACWICLPLAWGCATTQEVPLECVAEEVQIFVDGRLLERRASEVELRADVPHKLYFKREGHEPQLVVLEPEEGPDGSWQLVPDDVCVRLVPVGLGRELVIEAEERDGAP
jgi:hypothetical protein